MLQVDLPIGQGPGALDGFLEQGWFRNGYLLAFTPLICLRGDVYVTVPIRARLRGHRHGRSHARLLRRNAERFEVAIARPQLDEARERLYASTARRFGGFRMALLEDFLDAGPAPDFYDTWEVSVRDRQNAGKLVAASYFDVGRRSVASLLGLYDPGYARESLGIYTMLLEMEHAKARDMAYYYPGYVLQGHGWFDYKLRLGQMQYRTPGGRWRATPGMSRRSRLRERLYRRVEALEAAFEGLGLAWRRRVYPLFWLGEIEVLPELEDDYVAAPLLVECPAGGDPRRGVRLLAEYLPHPDVHLLSRVQTSLRLAHHIEGVPTAEMQGDARYLVEPLVRLERICEARDPAVLARRAAALVRDAEARA